MAHFDDAQDGSELVNPNAGDIALLTADLKVHRPTYTKYREYYDGKQEIQFAGEKLQGAFGDELAELTCNRVAPSVDTVADRLQVLGFSGENGETNKDAERIWTENGLDRKHGELHVEALALGDGYMLVWPDADGRARMYVQRAENIAVAFDEENPGEIRVAAKAWRLAGNKWRLNLYYRDRLEKYVTRNKQEGADVPTDAKLYEPFVDDGETWPVLYGDSWTGKVPVFHFANNGRTGEYGKSEVAAIIPLQDRLNMTLANLAIAEEFQSFRQRWATGLQAVISEETGLPTSPFTAGAGQLWASADAAVKFGDFEAADLKMFGETAEGHEVRIARTARIPLHHLLQAGAPESGEGRKVAEVPLVAKVKDRHNSFGPTWEDVIDFALRVEGAGDNEVHVIWERAEPRDERQFWELAAMKRELGVSPQEILREWGYTDKQIEQMRDEIAEHATVMAGLAAKAFNEGAGIDEQPANDQNEDDDEPAG